MRWILLIFLSLVTATANPWVGILSKGVTASAPTYLLNSITNSAAMAFSLTRKLTNGYSGNAFRVRRDTDGAELDIGFSGDLTDTNAMMTFFGSTNGYLVTVYDQSGNNRNPTRSTTNQQPALSIAGTMQVDADGHLVAKLDASDDSIAVAFSLTGPFSYYIVFREDTHVNSKYLVQGGSTTRGAFLQSTTSGNTYTLNSGLALNSTASNVMSANEQAVWRCSVDTGSTDYIKKNANTEVSGAAGSNGFTSITIGSSTACPGASFSELILFNTAVTDTEADDAIIRSDINTFYTIY